MSKYIENVNEYLSQKKIKQTYVSLKTGIDAEKLSQILTGAQPITGTDMEKIAKALGKNAEFFISDNFNISDISKLQSEKIVFYAGNPTAKQDELAKRLEKLLENIDEIMSAKQRFLNMAKE